MFIGEIVVNVLTILIVVAGILLIPGAKRPDTIIFQLAITQLPFVMGALVLSACVAFIVTTGDSFLLSASTNFAYDIWGKYIKKNATDKERLLVLRITVVVFAVIAYLLCMYFPTVLSVQMYSYTMYGAGHHPGPASGSLLQKHLQGRRSRGHRHRRRSDHSVGRGPEIPVRSPERHHFGSGGFFSDPSGQRAHQKRRRPLL
jgi:Na+/proline symporter